MSTSCGVVVMVAHHGFFIDIILGSGVPRHDAQDQAVYMEVVVGVRDTTSNLTLPWKIVSCKWPHLRAINQAKLSSRGTPKPTTNKKHTHTQGLWWIGMESGMPRTNLKSRCCNGK